MLVAEDNPVNQEVTLALLRSAGVEVDLAETGAEAVDLASHAVYDLILMDMQMPVMDGVEATGLIRGLPGSARVPILAMTGDISAESRAACIAAGMDGHLAKPVDPDALFAALARWLRVAAGPGPSPSAPATRLLPLAGIDGLDAVRGIAMFAGDASVYRRALEHFLALYGVGLISVNSALAGKTGARAALQREVHSLGGACAAIGAFRLESLAQSIDADLNSGQDGSGDAVPASLAALQALADQLATLVSTLLVRLHRC